MTTGYHNSCAWTGDGIVWCWGHGGTLGTGDTDHRLKPVRLRGLADITSVDAGGTHACALRRDGTVWCWGGNLLGQVGDGTDVDRLKPVRVPGLSNAIAVSAGDNFTCAVRQNETVWCWGWGYSHGETGSLPFRIPSLSDVTTLSADGEHACARRSNGTVWCWGSNRVGQLGDGTARSRLTPARVSRLSGVTTMSAGFLHTCARRSDGAAWCWGRNLRGGLGDGTKRTRRLPVRVAGLTGVRQVSVGSNHTCARRGNGTVWCWGEGYHGQLGDGGRSERTRPVKVKSEFAPPPPPLGANAFESRFTGKGAGQHRVAFEAAAFPGAKSYRWTFGDGQSGYGRKVSHRYRAARKVTAKLTVTFAGGYRRSKSLDIHTNAAVAFAPQLRFHPGETRMPGNARDFVRASTLFWSRPNCTDKLFARNPAATRLASGYWSTRRFAACVRVGATKYRTNQLTRPRAAGNVIKPSTVEGFYLDAPDSIRNGDLARAKVYYKRRAGGLKIRYWFFYPYNDYRPYDLGAQQHEGDWEMVEVSLTDQMRLKDVVYAAHGCGKWVPADAIKTINDSHPVVFVAKGSHASYWNAVDQGGPCQEGKDQVADSNRRWNTWRGGDLRNIVDQAWYGYGGGWGEVGELTFTTGPVGPPFAKVSQ